MPPRFHLLPTEFVAIKMAAGKARGGRIPHHFTLLQILFFPAGIKMVRDVTDEQRSRRPIFIATLRAAAKDVPFRGQDTRFPLRRRYDGHCCTRC